MSIQLSYSASQKYQMSPRSYYLHYVRRLRSEKTGSALVFGNAVDNAVNTMLKNKMENLSPGKTGYKDPKIHFVKIWERQEINGKKTDLRKTELIKYSKSDYDENILTDNEYKLIEKGFNKNWVSLLKKGIMMLEAYEEQIIPRINKVLAVQKYVKMTNEVGDSFVGWVDFICEWEDGNIYIVDNKTTSIKYKEDSVRTSPQLATYFEGTREEINPHGAMYIAIPKKFRKRKEPLVPIEVVKDQISEDLIETTFEEYDDTLYGIKMGNFPCTGCRSNPFGCVYKTYCESEGQDLTGLIYIGSSRNKK